MTLIHFLTVLIMVYVVTIAVALPRRISTLRDPLLKVTNS